MWTWSGPCGKWRTWTKQHNTNLGLLWLTCSGYLWPWSGKQERIHPVPWFHVSRMWNVQELFRYIESYRGRFCDIIKYRIDVLKLCISTWFIEKSCEDVSDGSRLHRRHRFSSVMKSFPETNISVCIVWFLLHFYSEKKREATHTHTHRHTHTHTVTHWLWHSRLCLCLFSALIAQIDLLSLTTSSQ